ncbi:hypothetical protein M9Y10_024422 [Tritrichomonas musculus]|uniref:DUF3447 domain-containing protein n=1 Tax=Tritrichomonas musculus TaxID=1915356 RepID=A0ABR2HBW7_9EUKA
MPYLLGQQEGDNYDEHEEKRRISENDSYICSLIREDLLDDFISYVLRSNFNIRSKIERSKYETNCFLIYKEPTIIEYAAFYGSIQVFQYLLLNNVELTPSLWIYGIHSNNAELIHLLERQKIAPPNKLYKECRNEAIKCHHNDIARYIINNYIPKKNSGLQFEP